MNAVERMTRVIEALRNVEFTCTPRADLPALPRLNVGSIIGGRGEGYVLTEPPYVPRPLHRHRGRALRSGQTADSVIADVRRALDPLKDGHPDFDYAIEIPPPACFKGCRRLVMDPSTCPRTRPSSRPWPGTTRRSRARRPPSSAPTCPCPTPPATVAGSGSTASPASTTAPAAAFSTRPGRQLHLHQRDGDVRGGAGAHGHGGMRYGMTLRIAPLRSGRTVLGTSFLRSS